MFTSKLRLFIILLLFFSMVFINTAWVAEDAFITFRAVDNLLAGHGPVWNIGERVQVYTHPLWYFLLSLGTSIFNDSYYFVLGLSYICLLGVLYCLTKIIHPKLSCSGQSSISSLLVIFPLVSLLLSRAFVDYSSSGLENPLIHVLLSFYILVYVSNLQLEYKFLITSILFNLIFLTRQDSILLITPTSLWLFYLLIKQKKAWFKLSLIAILPTIVWEVFSLIYYGMFIPNTALAKLNIGFERAQLLIQAKNFFMFNIKYDPLTLITIFLAIVVTAFNKNTIAKLLMLGVILQLIYITWVGADYMLGRFLSASLLVSVMSLLILDLSKENVKKLFVSCYGLLLIVLSVLQAPYILVYSKDFSNLYIEKGIADERGFYFQRLGLIPVIMKHNFDYQTDSLFDKGRQVKDIPIIEGCMIGMFGWSNQSYSYIVDPLALSEPFLSRLPANNQIYRPGHYQRSYPEGYEQSRLYGKNMIQNYELSKLYDDVEIVTKGGLWSESRWSAIYRLNTGYYQNLEQHFDRNQRKNCIDYITPEDM